MAKGNVPGYEHSHEFPSLEDAERFADKAWKKIVLNSDYRPVYPRECKLTFDGVLFCYITHTVNRVVRKHELLWELDKQRIAKRAECGYYGRVL